MAKVSVNNKAYSIIEKIAKGGSSFVFKVLSHRDHKNYALKAVPLEGIDQNTTRMYTNEIKLLISLRANPRIVQIFDYEISERHNALFVIMELGEIDMAHLLSRQKYEPLDLNFVRYYWRQMLKAVEAVHKEKIVHSDLKPANFVLVSGMLKIIDFGIAKRIANNTTNIHRDKQVGTINYMAPEALTDVGHGQNELMKMGRPSDVWSLGCILYQMVYGRPPFSDMKLFHKLRFIPDPTHVIPFPSQAPVYSPGDFTHDPVTLPAEIIDVMQSCLQRDPSKRKKIPQLLDHPFLKV
ncbi:kinase-like domain-containing protein [Radiomyces spectabilis]|uniref:kinase-like domain-containing protein n=1 Tax=Radiomyces spectabilis TaxID=64574 RepID=UPI002220288D|nr:kinase-like domain-containing protein [Radiomyces spectabilis]KAI8388460.1 kinase-like domain-containing protein [Radiomyces spectabilis]